jgi:hypothetical protein
MSKEKKSTRLHQIIAVIKGVNSRAESTTTRLHHQNKKPALFSGFRKVFKPLTEHGPQFPSESKLVQARVPDQIQQLTTAMSEQINVWWQRDRANQQARADVVVDDQVIIKGAPCTFLLALEKRLQDVRTFVTELPTRDTADEWVSSDAGIYRTPEVERVQKTQKMQEALVIFPPSDHCKGGKHEMITKDVLVGHWETVKQSGSISEDEKRALIVRIEKIIDAVKMAREDANNQEVELNPSVGQDLFQHIFH